MNKIDLKRPTSIDQDYALWCAEQGALLRAGKLDQVDRENLAEEIESLGRSDKDQIWNRLSVLVHHLLKWQFQPAQRSGSWKATLREQRARIDSLLKDSPSLKPYPGSVLAEIYPIAVLRAADEMGIAPEDLPADCPWTIAQILDPAFLPG